MEKPRRFAQDEVVRLIAVDPTTMLAPYLGQEGRIVDHLPESGLYIVEFDVGRATPDRGGQLGPRFVVKDEWLDPEVTEKMQAAAKMVIEAAAALTGFVDDAAVAADVYRAMRRARFER
jgi:hypothetical protein